MTAKHEYGDFQTPIALAHKVVQLVDSQIGCPDRVIEPTAGEGNFLQAAHALWGNHASYQGFEINPEYVADANRRLSLYTIEVFQQDFFEAKWNEILEPRLPDERLLVLGNPPWVTNATLGTLGSTNLPTKTNFQRLRGLDAKTGKANFDIAEWMLIHLIESLPESATLAMLCKTMTARKVLKHLWKTQKGFERPALFLIDARFYFDASVDACLFLISGKRAAAKSAFVYPALSTENKPSEFGQVNGHLVANLEAYRTYQDLDGGSPYVWRSGIKHDAAEVMELLPTEDGFTNGFGETVCIEPAFVYPLLKSSDIGNGRISPRRSVVVPQSAISDATDKIQESAPRTWDYLQCHSARLDGRKSSIYRNRPRFSIFGVGSYSFAPWKVAISGLYKSFRFVVVPPEKGRPIMLDDTCYFLPCRCAEEAVLLCELLNSEPCQQFLASLVFMDAKRPVTSEILGRISLVTLAQRLGRRTELTPYLQTNSQVLNPDKTQLRLVLEKAVPYGNTEAIS
ncbi:MAG: class I SAM-dependent methyltransferase [Armatimonadaceae bacterium]